MMYWYGGPGGWSYALMALSTVLFWTLLAVAVVVLVRQFGSDRRTPARVLSADPMLTLRERLARGEIDEDEYRRQVRILTGE